MLMIPTFSRFTIKFCFTKNSGALNKSTNLPNKSCVSKNSGALDKSCIIEQILALYSFFGLYVNHTYVCLLNIAILIETIKF